MIDAVAKVVLGWKELMSDTFSCNDWQEEYNLWMGTTDMYKSL